MKLSKGRGPKRKYRREHLREVYKLLQEDPTLSAFAAARMVAARVPGGGGTDENKARALLRQLDYECRQLTEAGAPGTIVLWPLALWGRATPRGRAIRREMDARDDLRLRKIRAARRAWGGLLSRRRGRWRATIGWTVLLNNDDEDLATFLARLDRCDW
jgi:hypothetical protein